MEDDTKYIVLVEKDNGEQMFTIEPNYKTARQNQEGHIRAGFTAVIVKFNGVLI